jgi:hypothetical protein
VITIVNPEITGGARNPTTVVRREVGLKAVTATAKMIEKAAAAVVIKQGDLSQAAVINQAAAIKVDRAITKAGNAIEATVEARAKETT